MTNNPVIVPQSTRRFELNVARHALRIEVIESLTLLDESQRSLIFANADTPFNQYEFLVDLENTGCVTAQSGWLPKYHLVFEHAELVGLYIAYEKHHSYGEYVFDWAWAQAYHQHGIDYYPKLLFAIPFTPVPCHKWLSSSTIQEFDLLAALANFYQHYKANETEALPYYSTVHLNFSGYNEQHAPCDLMHREGCQFHWFNGYRGNGQPTDIDEEPRFTNFDDFLSSLTARKRKSIKKERAKIAELGITCQWRKGNEISHLEANQFYQYYQQTYAKRGQQGYLPRQFFEHVFQQQSDNVRLLVCRKADVIVATALYFVDNNTLYGRYWGSNDQFDLLHFEACYYQGIEYCIRHQLRKFNPGTQGEHKIPRGFVPIKTHSYHSVFLPPFADAIRRFCADEKQYNRQYMSECNTRLPFKTDPSSPC